MIDIIIENKKLILPDSFTIRLSFNFPLPNSKQIPASSTYTVSVPAVEGNNEIFKNANFVYAANQIKIFDCLLVIAGNQIKGKLYLTDAYRFEYKFFIIINNPIANIAEKKLKDVVNDTYYLGDDEDAIIAEAKRLSKLNYPDAHYAFPMIRNEQFFDDKNVHFYKIVNNYWIGEYYKNIYHLGEVKNINALVAMPYLLHVLNNIFQQVNYSFEENLEDDFNKIIIYNNFANQRASALYYLYYKALDILATSYAYTQIIAKEIVQDDNNTYIDNKYYLNSATDYKILMRFKSNPLYNVHFYFSVKDENGNITVVDDILSSDADGYYELGNIVNLSATYITFQFLVNPVNTVGANAYISDVEIEIYPASEYFRDRFAKDIYLKNHLPDITVSEFINNLAKQFGWAVFFDQNWRKVKIEEWNNIIDDRNYIDLSDNFIVDTERIIIETKKFAIIRKWENDEMTKDPLPDIPTQNIRYWFSPDLPEPSVVGQILFVVPINHFLVTINDTDVLKWSDLTDNFTDIIFEEKTEDIEIKLSTLLSYKRNSTLNYDGFLPIIKQTGSTIETGINEPGFKLLNHHGFIDDNDFPYASNCRYDRLGNKTSGINFQLQGDEGMYERFLKKFYDYIYSRNAVEMNFRIDGALFQKIIKIYAADSDYRKVRVGSKNYIPEKADITVSKQGFQNCKLKLR